jgi:TRAP-type mannitol/chloroaromatic compound transport system substrate-binding protein
MLKKVMGLVTIATAGLLLVACEESPETVERAATAKTVHTLKLAETWPPNYPIFGDATKKLKSRVETMSDGRLQIRIDSANKHKAPLGIFDLVKAGQYDIGHSASYYWKGKDPNTLYFTTMPFGMTTPEQLAWFYHGGGIELMQKVYARHGMLSFPGGNTGNQMGGWFQKEINSVDDLQGLKMRIPGFAGEIMAKLGAKPTNIPGGELYTALERRTIDALEWVGPSLDVRMGFHKIAPYYYTGWHEPGAELQFLINKKKWDTLPADLQEILRVAMRATAYDMYIHAYHASGEDLAVMRRDFPDVEIKTFPPAVFEAMREANQALLSERAAADPLAKEIIESLARYREKARAWTEISDLAYLNSVAD